MESNKRSSSSDSGSNKKSASDPAPTPVPTPAPTTGTGGLTAPTTNSTKKSASDAPNAPATPTSSSLNNKRSITEPATVLRGSGEPQQQQKAATTWKDQRLSMERKMLLKYRNEEADRDEFQELSHVAVPPDVPDYSKHYNLLPDGVYENHRLLENISRQINTSLGAPEIVLVGYRAHGKSSLLEAITGQLIGHTGFSVQDGTTKRTVYYQFIDSDAGSASSPKSFIQFDALSKERNVEVPLKNLGKEIARRSAKISAEPIYVTIKAPNTLNITIIDTPGLMTRTEDMEVKAQIESIVLSVCNESENRLLLCVEEAASWKDTTLLPFIRRVDPSFYRACIVFTKFYSVLRSTLQSREAINRYLNGGKNAFIKCFWVTVPSQKARNKCSDAAAWQKLVWQTHYRDLHFLETHKAKKKYFENVGILSLRKYMMKEIWRIYLDHVPHALQILQKRKLELQQELAKLDKGPGSVNTQMMRKLANDYVSGLLSSLHRVIVGSSEAEPAIVGQTLEEEVMELGNIEWIDQKGTLTKVRKKWEVPFQFCKLYGGQQFDRLLAEFRAVSEHIELEEDNVSVIDLTAAVGTRRTSDGLPDCIWGACALAHQRMLELYLPLLDTAIERMVYIMRRSYDIASGSLQVNWKRVQGEPGQGGSMWEGRIGSSMTRKERENEENRPAGLKGGIVGVRGEPTKADNIENYPYFTGFVREIFEQELSATAMACKRKCLEEFLSVESIYWGYTQAEDIFADADGDMYDTALALTRDIFSSTKARITRSILLKLYQFFLQDFEDKVQQTVEGRVATLAEGTLEKQFQTGHVLKRMMVDSIRVKNEFDLCTKNADAFRQASAAFSVPLVTEMLHWAD